MERFDECRHLVVEFFSARASPEERNALAQRIIGHLAELSQARMAEPRDDMISRIIARQIDGRRLTLEALMSIGFLLFLAGLDTVTTARGSGMSHLAHSGKPHRTTIAEPLGRR